MSSDTLPDYTLYTELEGFGAPINTILFSADGNLIIAGGDDEKVRVWNTKTFRTESCLDNAKWGQITTLTWIYIDMPIDNKSTILAVASGRGNITLCPMTKGPQSRPLFSLPESKTQSIFDFNDAVEAVSYDRTNSKLAACSHSGQLKVFTLDTVSLKHLWTANVGNAIPRGIFFHGASNSLLMTLSLETGEICCREVESSQILWKKTLEGAIGSAALSSDQSTLIVNNLSNGSFEVYLVPSNSQTASLAFSETLRYPKQCTFSEGARVAVCGSITNKVYVVDVTTSEIIQTLTAGNRREMLQTVAATPGHRSGALIAGGSTKGSIYLWKRMVLEKRDDKPAIQPVSENPSQLRASPIGGEEINNLQIQIMSLVIILTYSNWSPYIWKFAVAMYSGLQFVIEYIRAFFL